MRQKVSSWLRRSRRGGAAGDSSLRRLHERFGGSLWLLSIVITVLAVMVVMIVVPRATGPASPSSTLVVASLPFWNIANGAETALRHRDTVNEVSPWMYGLSADSKIVHQYPPEREAEVTTHINQLRQAGVPIVPSLANITDGLWQYEPVARILHDPQLMEQHIDEIVDLVNRENYAGIDIDYENLKAGDRQAFTEFITKLGKELDAHDKILSVAVFAKETDEGYDERNVAQDYAALGKVADQVRLMAYDRHWATSPPGPTAPIDWVRSVVEYAKSEIPPERVVLGVPLYGYDWVGNRATSVTWLKALQLAEEHNVRPNYDTKSQTPWFRYTDDQGREHEVWFENSASSKAKFEVARGSGIRGVYLWMYGYEDTKTWEELKRSLPAGS